MDFFSTTLDLIHRSSFLLWSLRHTYINNTQGCHKEQSGQDVPVNILTQLKFWFIYTVKQPRKGSFFTWTCDLLQKPQPFRHRKLWLRFSIQNHQEHRYQEMHHQSKFGKDRININLWSRSLRLWKQVFNKYTEVFETFYLVYARIISSKIS